MEQKMESLSISNEGGAKPRVEYGKSALLAKKPRNKEGTSVLVETNVRKLTLKPNQPIFKYAVEIIYFYTNADGKEIKVEMSKSTKKGAEHDNCKHRCQKVYKEAIRKFPELQKGGPFFYDRQASLYSLSMLKDETKMSFTMKEGISKRPNFLRVEFKLSKVADSFQSTSNDVKMTFNACPKQVDKTLHEALNIIISGPAFENPGVVTIGNCVHYLYDHSKTGIRTLSFEQGGRYAGVGTSKSVKTLQGAPDGDKNVSLYITTELKTTLFHPDNITVVELLSSYEGFRPDLKANTPNAIKMRKAVTGLEVWADYGDSQGDSEEAMIFKIRGFGNSANNETFVKDGKQISVAQYFKKQYNITLRHPELFTIEAKGKDGGKIHIPAECLRLCPNQVVTNEQMVGKEQSELIKLSAAKPHERKNATDTVAREVGIAANTIQGFIKVGETEKVNGIVLPKPEIIFGGNKKVNWNDPNKRGIPTDFNAAGAYAKPMKLTNWELVFVRNESLPDVARLLVSEMKMSGMVAENPTVSYIQNNQIEPIFAAAKQNQRQLLFFVTKSRYDFHQEIKALEQQYDVLTQDMKFETALKLQNQPQTRKNIVNKTNMKLGGLNFLVQSPAFRNPARLIIGFETSSKGGGSGDLPVAVGFSANMMAHHQQYCGGYIYVKKDSDVYGPIIKDTVLQILQTVTAKRGEPNEIFVYFSGVTEGQYGRINELYLQGVKDACIATKLPNFRPHITLIASSKTHNERLYQGGRGVFNLEPGTAVDHTIVSPVYNEFYLASSVARQGTTKPAKFTIICSTNNALTMKHFEELTYDLCFEHQIVFHPVGLPIPLYLAGRNSMRGAMVLAQRGATFTNGVVDIAATNNRLNYGNRKLFETRFNA